MLSVSPSMRQVRDICQGLGIIPVRRVVAVVDIPGFQYLSGDTEMLVHREANVRESANQQGGAIIDWIAPLPLAAEESIQPKCRCQQRRHADRQKNTVADSAVGRQRYGSNDIQGLISLDISCSRVCRVAAPPGQHLWNVASLLLPEDSGPQTDSLWSLEGYLHRRWKCGIRICTVPGTATSPAVCGRSEHRIDFVQSQDGMPTPVYLQLVQYSAASVLSRQPRPI